MISQEAKDFCVVVFSLVGALGLLALVVVGTLYFEPQSFTIDCAKSCGGAGVRLADEQAKKCECAR